MNLKNLNTTSTLLNTTKQIQKLTSLDLRQNRVNHALTCSNVQIVKAIIKPIPINTLSNNTNSTKNSIPRNIRSFVKTEDNQLVQL